MLSRSTKTQEIHEQREAVAVLGPQTPHSGFSDFHLLSWIYVLQVQGPRGILAFPFFVSPKTIDKNNNLNIFFTYMAKSKNRFNQKWKDSWQWEYQTKKKAN